MDKSWVDRVLNDLIICGSKPMNEVIKATMPEHITMDIVYSLPNVQILF